jgi:excisionase family DNA binding protein
MARWLNMTEAAEHVGHVTPRTLYRLASEGNLPVRRVGRKIVISEKRLDEWADGVGDVREQTYPKAD